VKVTTRRLSPDDSDAYRRIRLEALGKAPDAYGSSYSVEAALPLAAFRERLANTVVLAAYRGAELVGMAGLMRGAGMKERHKARLWGMYVREDSRHLGIGKALVSALIEEAPQGIEQISLAVVEENRSAVALYQALGFQTYGVERRALKVEDRYFDEALMVRFLAPSRLVS
jgi:ribosomal protein S18 acetylase RimI-like enzyme